MRTIDELKKCFEGVDEQRKKFAYDTIEEYLFFLEKIEELKQLPLIQISPKNPQLQKVTTAGKLIKDYSAIVDSKRNTLLKILGTVENSATDELLAKLMEFE